MCTCSVSVVGKVKPHVSSEELENTRRIVKSFYDGIGKELHEKLLKKASKERNWFEYWWMDFYLKARGSPNYSASYYGMVIPFIDECWQSKEGSQVERCAVVLWNVLQFWKMLREETLPLDIDRNGTTLSMYQYRSLFNSSRVPGVQKDTFVQWFKTAKEGNCPSHLIVMRKGRFYKFNATDDDGKILSAPALKRQIEYVKTESDNQPTILSVGMLTALDRIPWAQARSHLQSLDPRNKKFLDEIESSLLILRLEDKASETLQSIARESLCGIGHGRWFDKGYTLISFKNGTFGLNIDHVQVDAICPVNHWIHVNSKIIAQDGIWKGSTDVRKLSNPQELKFIVDDHITNAIRKAVEQSRKESKNIETSINKMNFDRELLRCKKVHPDAFLQLAIQYTYYKMYRRPAPTNEAATTRQFYHGRTETVRACTVEAIQWCQYMTGENIEPSKTLNLFLTAINKHVQLMGECKRNEGCHRHLYGLEMIAAENGIPLPELYKDPSYMKSGGNESYILVTSSSGYSPVLAFIPPMCENGYGVFYSFPKNALILFVSSWKKDKATDCVVYRKNLEKTINEMLAMLTNSNL
uniref:Peroxisomal carnitine O-octanoyltransferase-like n=1 Tax=Saccoglossus kowalevskii TaxID=10224 RepID=A0ABM0LTT4_SACKO|nr:PREDICTED: peroxisomal carnitine O-octanoyltransferase-like [Saccoglossus kowalevskii]